MNTDRRRFVLLAAGLLAAALLAAAPGAAFDAARFAEEAHALAAAPHRLAGSDAALDCATRVYHALRAMGVRDLLLQPVPAWDIEAVECRVDVEGRSLPLLPLRPNLFCLPVTPPDGVAGPLVYAGKGRYADFGERPARGAIVLLDYDSPGGWQRAFALGARAVVYLPDGSTPRGAIHHVNAPVNYPRFFAEPPVDAVLRNAAQSGSAARLASAVRWRPRVADSVLAYLPAIAAPSDEVLVLAAPLDSFGDVPHRAPGARAAANAAGLLETARLLLDAPRRRPILLAFLAGEANAHAGAAALYQAIGMTETERQKPEAVRETIAFLHEQMDLIRQPRPLENANSRQRNALLNQLKEFARTFADEVSTQIREARLDLKTLDDPAAREVLSASLELWLEEKSEWNDFRWLLGRGQTGLPDSRCLNLLRRTLLESNAASIEDTRRHLRETEAQEVIRDWTRDRRVVLHLAFNLGDALPHWSLLQGGASPHLRLQVDEAGAYARVFKAIDTVAESEPARWPHFERGPLRTLVPGEAIAGGPFSHSGEMASIYGVFNLSCMTIQDTRPRDGHPADTLQALDLDGMARQLEEAAALVVAMAGSPEMSLRQRIQPDADFADLVFKDRQVSGPRLVRRIMGQTGIGHVRSGAMVTLQPALIDLYPPPTDPSYISTPLIRADEGGFFPIGPLPKLHYDLHQYFAARFDARGSVIEIGSQDTTLEQRGFLARQINLVQTRGCAVLSPPGNALVKPAPPLLLDARTNSAPSATQWRGGTLRDYCYAFVPRRVRELKVFNSDSLVLLGIDPDCREEAGIAIGELAGTDLVRRSALDLWRLNEKRLRVLREKRVTNDSLEWLHGEAGDLLAAAETENLTEREAALNIWSRWISRRVYRPLLDQLNDLVRAVVLLLFLAIPFAFSLERLLFGSPHIYRQVGAFAVLFVLTFVLLYLSHPAFQIATSPMIVFLAFVIVLLSSMVLTIIVRRFKTEMKAFQGLEQTVHSADVSRTATLLAGVQMGISAMRRRPLRTTLTAVTVLLLTFSILTFASFEYTIGVARTTLGPPTPGTAAVLVHDPLWQQLPAQVEETFAGRFRDRALAAPRYWWADSPGVKQQFLLYNEDGTRSSPLGAAVGLADVELARVPGLVEALGLADRQPSDLPWIVLPEPVRRELGVRPGDAIRWQGTRLEVAGAPEAARIGALGNIDGSSILPIDYQEQRGGLTQEQALRYAESIDPSQLVPVSVDTVAFVDARAAQRLGGEVRAVSLYFDDPAQVREAAEQLATVYEYPVYASDADGAYRCFFTTRLAASGWQSLVFPLLLGGLIVLGTMLGSVADRQREIYTFSAMGLAPRHVAGLFFAEAALYAIIGGQGGYLLSQAVTRILGLLADRGLVQAPELNYSSTNAIVTILIVMATVLVSTVYPALKASREANPGIQRLWRIPPPKGDLHELVFPFTVSEYDLIGIVSFLNEHFDSYRDSSFGSFMAHETQIELDPDTGLPGMSARVSLAPFDLGISQTFRLRCTPSEIPNIDEVQLVFRRTSGTVGDWKRSNRRFIEDLRRQFLIWRALAEQTADLYRQRTLARFPQLAGKAETRGTSDESPDGR